MSLQEIEFSPMQPHVGKNSKTRWGRLPQRLNRRRHVRRRKHVGDTFSDANCVDDREMFTGAHCQRVGERLNFVFFSFTLCFLFFVCHQHRLLLIFF